MTTTERRPTNWIERISNWIDAVPEFWRPAVFGAGLVLMWMGMRGAVFVLPILVAYVLITSQTPFLDIGKGVIVVAMAMIGGALSGLAYSVVGRRLLMFRPVGRYLMGVVTLVPYMFVLTYIIAFTKGQSVFHRPSTEDIVIGMGMAVVFGAVMGHSWFRDAN